MPRRINHWWTTRPKRKLITIVDVLRVFLTIAEGKKWRGNKNLHLEFEKALANAGLKGGGERRDKGGGGGRTYAAWLFSFGLWFATDSDGIVHATFAGDDLMKGADPVPIVTAQLLNFRYPSPYAKNTRINSRFKLFPFRFLLELLLDPKLSGYLTENEIAGIVITRAETTKDSPSVIEEILRYRKSGKNDDVFRDKEFVSEFGNFTKLKDSANTLINQLEFTQLITRGEGSVIRIPSERKRETKSLIENSPNLISRFSEFEYFQRKYGLGPNHKRDNRTFRARSTVSAASTEKSKVLLVLWEILAREPIKAIDSNMIARIALKTGIRRRKIERIISDIGVTPSYDVFESKYLEFSMGERKFATEFEKSTEGIFGPSGLGFHTKWIGSSPNSPDVLAISSDSDEPFLGILDSKAYKNYTISGDHRRRMSHVYIPKFESYEYDGKQIQLGFFSYVAGGLGNTIERGIKKIFDETGTSGCAITAHELLGLLRKHRYSPLQMSQLRKLFTLNKQILPTDINP